MDGWMDRWTDVRMQRTSDYCARSHDAIQQYLLSANAVNCLMPAAVQRPSASTRSCVYREYGNVLRCSLPSLPLPLAELVGSFPASLVASNIFEFKTEVTLIMPSKRASFCQYKMLHK
jgi:hypothetical protein